MRVSAMFFPYAQWGWFMVTNFVVNNINILHKFYQKGMIVLGVSLQMWLCIYIMLYIKIHWLHPKGYWTEIRAVHTSEIFGDTRLMKWHAVVHWQESPMPNQPMCMDRNGLIYFSTYPHLTIQSGTMWKPAWLMQLALLILTQSFSVIE